MSGFFLYHVSMKNINILIVVVSLTLTSTAAICGLFPPSNFEDCVLEGIKDAKNEAAVNAIYQMCGRKFPKQDMSAQVSTKGVKLCNLYWNGWNIVSGDMSNDKNFKLYKLAQNGVHNVNIFFPTTMVVELKNRANGNEEKGVADFANQNSILINQLCTN